MIETEWAVLVGFHVETQCFQFVDKFLLSEHFIVGMVRYFLEGYPDSPFPRLGRQVLEQKLSARFSHPVHFRQGIAPIGSVVNAPDITPQVESRIRKIEVCNIAFHKGGTGQSARLSLRPCNHPGVQVNADVSLRAEQVVENPGTCPLATADLEDIVCRSF